MLRPGTTRSKHRATVRHADDRVDEHAGLARQLALARFPREPFHPKALPKWGVRLGVEAQHASWLKDRREPLGAEMSSFHLRRFMTGGGPRSALDIEATPWLRMTETQITSSLASFISEGGPRRVLAFIRALPCSGVTLPDTLDSGRAAAEVQAAGGRVDLLVTGRRGNRTYGAAVEVKIDHRLHIRSALTHVLPPRKGWPSAGARRGPPPARWWYWAAVQPKRRSNG
jgi:hypothetical protein